MTRIFFYFFIGAVALLGLYVALTALYDVARAALGAYRRYRGRRLVVCPETREYVAVEVDAAHAAATAPHGHTDLRLATCTRWPERAGCDEACVAQIERAPEDCLVARQVNDWYAARACVYCGAEFGPVNWHEHAPALRAPDGRTVQWTEVAPERLPEIFRTHQPVCWNCHVAQSFRAAHADIVVERPWVH
ncbi:MAG TPA: hypothetical protein VF546_10990 [Pyrinomonadaceae bacterium]|jgi:hypothetical protein